MESLIKEVQVAVHAMKPGDVSAPIRYGTEGRDEATLVVQLHEAPKVPSYEDVKDQMMDHAFAEAVEKQRKLWLADLRRGAYVDVRL
jgi:hypothetical protein